MKNSALILFLTIISCSQEIDESQLFFYDEIRFEDDFYFGINTSQTIPNSHIRYKGKLFTGRIQYEDNNQCMIKTYKNGVETQGISYYLSGRKKEEMNFVDRKSDGEYIAWYDLDGNPIKWFGVFDKGYRVGKWIRYHPNGKIIKEIDCPCPSYEILYSNKHVPILEAKDVKY